MAKEFGHIGKETPSLPWRYNLPTYQIHKAIGVGEISTAPGPSAVLMAVYNATGKRLTEYPAMPDRILKALGKV